MGALNYGDRAARLVSQRQAAPVATIAALKAVPPAQRASGQQVLIVADGSRWRFHPTSALTGDDLLVIAPTTGSGRWLRVTGACDLAMPITFATADAAVLLTMPAGAVLKIEDLFWEVTADWTGGTNSAIGASSNKTAPTDWSTKGDLLGGATGDVLATLVASVGIVAGTVGTDMDTVAKRRGAIWKATDTIRFDRITSVFTAGSGNLHVFGNLLAHAGA